jgi:guanylate kinase
MLKFDNPTLVTLTAPTASGKSYLLNALTERGLFSRIVSTTTRDPREGEREGVDYNFITVEKSQQLERLDQFFELIEFNGTRYGVTHAEMEAKIGGPQSPLVVLEPQGLAIYEQKCREKGWDIYKIFVHVTESVRTDRLLQRTLSDVWSAIDNVATIPNGRYSNAFSSVATETAKKKAAKAIGEHHKRLIGLEEERHWSNTNRWDAIVPGDNVDKAIAMLEHGVKWRNRQRAEPQAMGAVKLPL